MENCFVFILKVNLYNQPLFKTQYCGKSGGRSKWKRDIEILTLSIGILFLKLVGSTKMFVILDVFAMPEIVHLKKKTENILNIPYGLCKKSFSNK